MAEIIIREQDLTTAPIDGITENIVYVPGYAIMGPVNEPILCENLASFKSIFGSTPYRFKHANSHKDISYAVDDYEKSYLYAAEILNSGLPVMFERVVTKENPTYAQQKLSIKLHQLVGSPVTFTPNIDAAPNDTTITYDKGSKKYSFEFSYGKDLYEPQENSSLIFGDTDNIFTITTEDEQTYTCEGLSEITVTLDKESTHKITVKFTIDDDSDIDINIFKFTYTLKNRVAYTVKTEYAAEKGVLPKVYLNDSEPTSDVTLTEVGTNAYRLYNEILKCIVTEGTTLFETENLLDIRQNLIIKAKYPGEYGGNIKFEVLDSVIDGYRYYTITPTLVLSDSSKETGEPCTITFDPQSPSYVKGVTNDLLDIDASNFLESKFVNYYKYLILDNIEDEFDLEYTGTDEDEFDLKGFYTKLTGDEDEESIFDKLADKGEYNIKYITAGGYPTYFNADISIVRRMLLVAANRGDCLALIDHEDIKPQDVYNRIQKDLVRVTSNLGEDARKYGAMFTPWAKYQLNTFSTNNSSVIKLPASFAYLMCLAGAGTAKWKAISGVIRGQVYSLLEQTNKLTGAIADKLQSRKGISINPITNIRPYGYCIWGNRTLLNNPVDLTASSFLNIRNVTNDVKKVVYTAAKQLTFELNDNILWLNFKSKIEPTLEQMKSDSAISNYRITKLATNKKATIVCKITLYAVEALEDWDITVELADNYVSIQ